MLREMGIPVSGQWVHGTTEYGGRIASLTVPAERKGWAEEILFVQGTAVPERMNDLEPATRRRMETRGPYTPRQKWQKRTAKPVGIKGRLMDFVAGFAGFTPRRGVRDIEVADKDGKG